jgi:hypothetical protein
LEWEPVTAPELDSKVKKVNHVSVQSHSLPIVKIQLCV